MLILVLVKVLMLMLTLILIFILMLILIFYVNVNVNESVEHLILRPHTKIQPAVSPLVSVFPGYRFNNNRNSSGLLHKNL